VWRISLFVGENKLRGYSSVDGGESSVVIVDGDGSRVVAGEPRREVRFGGFLALFPAFDDTFDGFCGAISRGLHEVCREW